MNTIRAVLYVLLGISLAVSISATLIVSALLLAEWGVRSLRKDTRSEWKKSPLDIPIAFYFLWGVFVAFVNQSASFTKSVSTQSAFLIFFLIAHGSDLENVKKIVLWFFVASGFMGFWGLMQGVLGIDHLPTQETYAGPAFFCQWPEGLLHILAVRNGRAVGFRSHPLTYAEGFIPVFFIALICLIRVYQRSDRPWKDSWPLWLIAALVSAGILLAQGRAVWLGLGVGCLFLMPALPKRWIPVILPAALGFFIVVMAVFPGIRGRLFSVFLARSGSQSDQSSKSIRVELWKGTVDGIKDNPILGVGLRGVELKLKPGLGYIRVWSETHNVFLQNALERGLVGFGIFVWIWIVIVRLFWGLPPPWKWGMLAALAAFFIAGMTESWMKDKEVCFIFWVMVGCAEAWRLTFGETKT